MADITFGGRKKKKTFAPFFYGYAENNARMEETKEEVRKIKKEQEQQKKQAKREQQYVNNIEEELHAPYISPIDRIVFRGPLHAFQEFFLKKHKRKLLKYEVPGITSRLALRPGYVGVRQELSDLTKGMSRAEIENLISDMEKGKQINPKIREKIRKLQQIVEVDTSIAE